MKIKTYIATFAVVYPIGEGAAAGSVPTVVTNAETFDSQQAADRWCESRMRNVRNEDGTMIEPQRYIAAQTHVTPSVIDVEDYKPHFPTYAVRVIRTSRFYTDIVVDNIDDEEEAVEEAMRMAEEDMDDQDWQSDGDDFEMDFVDECN